MNQDIKGNRKLFWKEVIKENGGKVQFSNKIKDGNGRLVLEEAEVQRIWKEFYEDLYNIDTQEQVAVHRCSFYGIRKSNYFGGEPIRIGEQQRLRKEWGSFRMKRLQVRMRSQGR